MTYGPQCICNAVIISGRKCYSSNFLHGEISTQLNFHWQILQGQNLWRLIHPGNKIAGLDRVSDIM